MVVISTNTDLLVMHVSRAPWGNTIYQINPGHLRVPRKVFRVSVIQETAGNLKDNSSLFLHAVPAVTQRQRRTNGGWGVGGVERKAVEIK